MIDKSVIVLASRNQHKLREIRTLLRGLRIRLLPLPEGIPPVEETGATFLENATLKAVAYSRATGKLCLAEDSGIEVDALGGAPGVRSSRYSGGGDEENNRKLLEALKDVPEEKRTCRYRAAAAVAFGGQVLFTAEGVCEGRVARAPAGTAGFGYDPIFYVPQYGQTMAQLGLRVKNRISHRRQAMEGIRRHLEEFLRAPG